MHLRPAEIREFQRLYKNRKGEEIDYKSAEFKLGLLVKQLLLLTDNMTEEHHLALDVMRPNENEDEDNGKSRSGSNS